MALCLVTITMVTGCGWLFSKRSPEVRPVPLAKIPGEIVKLERSFSADGEAVNMGYGHPHEFSEQAMGDEVAALVVRRHKWGKYGMGSEWISRPAFTASATERLVPALVMAFKEASPSDKILFHVTGKTGQPTSGEVYLQDNELVWIFKEIDGRTYLGKDIFTLDSEDWRIEEKAGMTVRKNKSAKVMKVVRNLSVAPEVTAAAMAEEQPSQPPAAAPPAPVYRELREPVVSPPPPREVVSPGLEELEKKLQTLKKWQESGLINDEDYEKQKTQILEQLQKL